MKKIVTASLIAASLIYSSNAFAVGNGGNTTPQRFINANKKSDIELEMSGFLTWYVAASNQKKDLYTSSEDSRDHHGRKQTGNDNIGLISDSEIDFEGSYQFEDGEGHDTHKLSFHLGLDAVRGDIDVDESYIQLQNNYGRFVVGNYRNVGKAMAVRAPDISKMGISSTNATNFVKMTDGLAVNQTEYSHVDKNTAKIAYFTPKINGIQIGVDVMASDSSLEPKNTSYDNKKVRFDRAADAVIKYTTKINDYDFAASFTYDYTHPTFKGALSNLEGIKDEKDIHQYGYGIRFGQKNWEFGGTFRKVNASVDIGKEMKYKGRNIEKGWNWSAGYLYKWGKYRMSASILQSRAKNFYKRNKNDVFTIGILAFDYIPVNGVNLYTEAGYIDMDSAADTSKRTSRTPFLVAGIALNF
ncbi:MAG: porin [Alphaproteobacteria bacterium]|nr:porin [Alphaproteobacteria bacterium]